jgi:hypothetical protein
LPRSVGLAAASDGAAAIEEIDLPTFRLHRLKGDLKGQWAVTVGQIGESFFASTTDPHMIWISLTTIDGCVTWP